MNPSTEIKVVVVANGQPIQEGFQTPPREQRVLFEPPPLLRETKRYRSEQPSNATGLEILIRELKFD